MLPESSKVRMRFGATPVFRNRGVWLRSSGAARVTCSEDESTRPAAKATENESLILFELIRRPLVLVDSHGGLHYPLRRGIATEAGRRDAIQVRAELLGAFVGVDDGYPGVVADVLDDEARIGAGFGDCIRAATVFPASRLPPRRVLHMQ